MEVQSGLKISVYIRQWTVSSVDRYNESAIFKNFKGPATGQSRIFCSLLNEQRVDLRHEMDLSYFDAFGVFCLQYWSEFNCANLKRRPYVIIVF
jgi:hypothetical protein